MNIIRISLSACQISNLVLKQMANHSLFLCFVYQSLHAACFCALFASEQRPYITFFFKKLLSLLVNSLQLQKNVTTRGNIINHATCCMCILFKLTFSFTEVTNSLMACFFLHVTVISCPFLDHSSFVNCLAPSIFEKNI